MSTQQPEEREADAARLHEEAQRLYDRGEYALARPLFERALALRRATLGDDALATAKTLGALALVIAQQGDPAAAQPLIERTLAIRRRVFGPDNPDVAEALNNLGFIRRMRGDDEGARRLYEQALAIRERVLGPDDPATANSLSNLGVVAAAQRDFEAARRHHERALGVFERAAGPDDVRTGRALNNLAAVLAEQGDLAAAAPLLERSLAIHERALDLKHPSVANVLTNLADLRARQRDYAGARRLCERALIIREQALGAAHPRTAESARKLLSALTMSREMTLALPLNRICQALARSPEHPDPAAVEALHAFVDRLNAAMSREPLSPSDERALAEAAGLQQQADALLQRQNFPDAQVALERALTLREEVLGPNDFQQVELLKRLGMALQAQGEYDRLPPLQERIVAIHVHALGEDHPMTELARAQLMGMRIENEEFEAALPEMEQMRASLLRQLRSDDPLAQTVQSTRDLMDQFTAMLQQQLQQSAEPKSFAVEVPPDEAVLSEALARLDDVPWRTLGHAYGPATDVPALLRELVSPDTATRRRAYHHLYGNVWHQGSVYEATAYVVPFLIKLLAIPSAPSRPEILRLITTLAEDDGTREQGEDREAAAAHQAAAEGLPLYLDLLDGANDPELRLAAVAAVAIFPKHAVRSVPRLRAAFEAEQDSLARVWLLAALGQVMEASQEALAFLGSVLRQTHDPRQAFLAAAALTERARAQTPAPAVETLLHVFGAVDGGESSEIAADLDEAMERFDAFGWPRATQVAILRLTTLGQTRAQPALQSALQRTRDPDVAREIAEALLDLAFNDGRLQSKGTAIMKGSDGRLSVNYWKPDPQPQRSPATLSVAQSATLEALATHDPFWEQDHDLLGLYGLPSHREALRAFLAQGRPTNL